MKSFLFSPVDFHTCKSWQLGARYVLNDDLECIQPLGGHYPSLARYCHLASAVMGHWKAIPPFYQASYFKMVGNMVRPAISMSTSPLMHFICRKVIFWSEAILSGIPWQQIKHSFLVYSWAQTKSSVHKWNFYFIQKSSALLLRSFNLSNQAHPGFPDNLFYWQLIGYRF